RAQPTRTGKQPMTLHNHSLRDAAATTAPMMTCDVVIHGKPERSDPQSGTCFCGAVAINVEGAPLEMGYCHCISCRSYSGAPMSAFILWSADQVSVTRGAEFLGGFSKSEMSRRRFCTNCGGHIMTEHSMLGLIDVRAGVLPGIAFKPIVHLNYIQTVLPLK